MTFVGVGRLIAFMVCGAFALLGPKIAIADTYKSSVVIYQDTAREAELAARKGKKESYLNNLGLRLLDTPSLSVHVDQTHTRDVSFSCLFGYENRVYRKKSGSLNLSISVKDPNTRIDKAYVNEVLRSVIAPNISHWCPDVSTVKFRFYFDGIYFSRQSERLTQEQVRSNPLLAASFASSYHSLRQPIPTPEKTYVSYLHDRCRIHFKCETIEELELAAAREFLPKTEFDEKQRLLALEKAAAGGPLRSEAVKSLVYGGDYAKEYFESHRTTRRQNGAIVSVMFAYTYVVNDKCPISTPGGTTIAVYSRKNSNGVLVGEEVMISVPLDMYDHIEFVIEGGQAGVYRRTSANYGDLSKIVDKHGCNSDWHQKIHAGISEYLYTLQRQD